MYRGPRPHRGGYHHPLPPPPSRGFGRHSGVAHHADPDPYRRPSPHRRYPSPGAGRPPRAYGSYSPPSPRSSLPVDHSLVITVGNELTRSSGYTDPEPPYVRDYSAGDSRYRYSPRNSSYDEHSDRGLPRHSISRGRSRGRSRSPSYERSKSRARSRSRSYSRGRSPERAKSRCRSRSRPRRNSYSRSRSRSRSRARSRARSRGRSKSRARSRSSSSGRSHRSSASKKTLKEEDEFSELVKARRRKEIQDMLVKPAKSILKKRLDSSETDSPMLVQNSDSPQANPDGGLSHETEQILSALNRTLDSNLLSSYLGKSGDGSALEELISQIQSAKESGGDFALAHQKGSEEKAGLTQLHGRMFQPPNIKKRLADIEDEERFLYGEDNEEKKVTKEIPMSSAFLDTQFPKSQDFQTEPATASYTLGHFGDSSHPHNPYSVADVDSKEDTSEFPSGVKPKDADARNDVEDYEKIQDLLKTIGLDLGVAEISKMAARTQERLHGNISAKTLARRPASRKCRSNSGSSSRSSSRSRSSSNSSSGSSRSRKKAISSEPRTSTSQNNSKVDSQPDKAASSWSTPSTTPTPVTQPFPPPPNLPPMPPFHQPPPRGVMPQDFSSCGFGNYGNYVPYMPPGWPMYPPPALPVPPPSQMNPYNQTNVNRPFTKGIGSREGKSGKASSLDTEASSVMSSSQRRMSDDMNTASQKQKVTEELEKLKKDKELRLKRKDRLLLELETLRKQHGELLRKKRREKDGHKDPILLELGKIQDNIMGQISCLRSEQKEEDQKHEELVKVALILGIDYKETKTHDEHMPPPPLSRKELVRSPERVSRNSKASSMKPRSSPERVRRSPPKSRSVDTYTEQFEYYDAGNHWCKNCNVTSGSMFDYFMHLHSKTHRKTLDPYYRPWAKFEDEKKSSAGERISKPSKGSEFLIPVRGFFCQLCAEFFGDPVCAEAHVTCHVHNERYKKKMYDNPLYEQRRNLDRQAGLETLKNLEHKRKRKDSDTAEVKKSKQKFCDEAEDKLPYSKEESKKIKESESKLKEDYFKYKKEDKDKQNYKKENVDTYKVKKEDETVVHKKEEQRIRYSMDEDDSYKFKKEGSRYDNDRYRNKDNDDDDDSNDKKKYHYRGDDDKHRFRKKDDGTRSFREDEEPKYGKDLFKRQKNYRGVGKMSRCKEEDSDSEDERESRGGYEKDGKTKKDSTEKMISKEKPSEPPKILCGPSPALLAKLRKKNVEAPVRPGTGKVFKKAQKTALEKEAERIAAQFIKEDEESLFFKSEGSNDAAKDPFSKSIAAAKSIAMKLSTKGNLTPSDQWLAYNENKSSPTLPPSSSPVLVRKSYTGAQNKSVLPSTDKSSSVDPTSKEDNQINVTPESSAGSIQKPVLLPTCSSTPEIQQQKQLDSKIQPQAKSTPELQQQKQPNPEIQHQKQPNPEIQLQTESTSEIQQEKEPNPKIQPQTELTQNIQQQEELTPTSVPEKTNPIQMNPVASNECVFTLESDVPAPGVPEEEQMLTVVIRPPPTLLSKPKNPLPKSGKPKTLAAGKAKDLFNIFYSGSTTVKPSIISGDKKASLSTPPDTSRNKCSDSKDSNEENHDRPVAEDKEPLKNDCLEVLEDSTSVVAIKGNDQEVVQPEESVKDQESVQQEESEQQEESKDSIVQHEDHFKSEDTCVVSDEKPLEYEDWNVQTEESIMTEDSKATRGEESPKNSFSNSYQNEDIFEMTPPIIIFESCESNVGEGQESLMVEDTGNLDKFGETQVDEMTKQQLFETSETSEVDDLIMKEKKLETMQANDGEMLLESEEPMSFSPIPGSFTEQLNLDTFDFSFEPL